MLAALKQKIFGQPQASKSHARNRLHFVLVQDRSGLSNEDMSEFKAEMVEVMERYFVIDKSGFDIAYKRDGDSSTLVINSPVVVKRQEAAKGRVGAKNSQSRKKRKNKNRSNNGPQAVVQGSPSSN